MNGKLLVLALILGVAAALPRKGLKTLRTRKNTASNGGSRVGIYDGTATTIEKHPYIVGITIDDEFYCAGAIVGESYVLTLGDCAEDLSASELTVVAGSSDGSTGTSYTVKKIITNPSYGEEELSYDFALLKIKGTFTWGDTIGNVSLPSAEAKSGAALVAVGWGDTSAVGASTSTMYQGTMKYVTETNCESYYSEYDLTWDASMSCAYNKGKVTMCDDDFGDPFVKGGVLYGLMAAGGSDEFCTSSAIPVLLADVYTVVDWIQEYID